MVFNVPEISIDRFCKPPAFDVRDAINSASRVPCHVTKELGGGRW